MRPISSLFPFPRFAFPVTLLLAVVFALLAAPPVQALTVSPVRLEITVNPGSTYQGETILKNEQREERTFYSSFENFEARGDTGTPYFIPGKDGLAGWIGGVTESLTLQPGERQVIPFTISVPSDAKPGGYFTAILWNDTPPVPSAGGQVAIGAKVGSLVLLRVAGDVDEKGGIAGFSTTDGDTLFTSLPVSFVWRFQNSGGDRVKPEGTIRIKNLLGLLSAELPANPTKGNILPGSTRRFDVAWQERAGSGSTLTGDFLSSAWEQARTWRMGRYVAQLQLTYGEEGSGNATFAFYVLPWQLLSLIAVALLAILLIGRLLLSGYKRRILAAVEAASAAKAPATPSAPRKSPRRTPAASNRKKTA